MIHVAPGSPWGTKQRNAAKSIMQKQIHIRCDLLRYNYFSVWIVKRGRVSISTPNRRWTCFKLTLENSVPPDSAAKMSPIRGRGYWSTSKTGLRVTLKSPQQQTDPSFSLTENIGVAHSLKSLFKDTIFHQLLKFFLNFGF